MRTEIELLHSDTGEYCQFEKLRLHDDTRTTYLNMTVARVDAKATL